MAQRGHLPFKPPKYPRAPPEPPPLPHSLPPLPPPPHSPNSPWCFTPRPAKGLAEAALLTLPSLCCGFLPRHLGCAPDIHII
eukprot:4912933-Pyramimonas_sp.AAC.1